MSVLRMWARTGLVLFVALYHTLLCFLFCSFFSDILFSLLTAEPSFSVFRFFICLYFLVSFESSGFLSSVFFKSDGICGSIYFVNDTPSLDMYFELCRNSIYIYRADTTIRTYAITKQNHRYISALYRIESIHKSMTLTIKPSQEHSAPQQPASPSPNPT